MSSVRSSTSSTPSVSITTMLSMTFLSSRTFPGQRYWRSTFRTAGVIDADLLAVRGGELLEEMIDQERHVLTSFAERGKLDADDLETVVEVLAELAGGDGVGQVAVGGRDQADVDLDRLVGAHPDDLAGLERPRSSLTWIARGMSPTSSRNSVPPLACSNQPLRSRSAPVNAPLTWPKSSLSRMFSLSSAQLSGDERLVLALGLLMCRALATSSLPVPLSPVISTEADVGAIWRSLATTACMAGELPMTPSKPNFSLSCFWQLDVRPCQPLRLRGLVGDRPQLADIQRLGQVRRGAGLHGGDGRLDRAVAGEDHDLGVGQLALGLGQDLQAADPIHDQVGDDDVEGLFLDQPQALAAAGGHDALVADPLEALGHGVGVGFIVVDHQGRGSAGPSALARLFRRVSLAERNAGEDADFPVNPGKCHISRCRP